MTEHEIRQWNMLMHLSQFAGYVVPLAGVIVPIVMWQSKKDVSPDIDAHGRMIANAMISFFCYWITVALLAVTIIGIPIAILLGIALGICSVAFPIIGAIKANEGEHWSYPLVVRFL